MIPNPRILFVDDEEHILRALRRHFMDDPYDIHTATSALEGLALIEQTPMDVVISDFRMPGMDGGEFLKLVGARWPDTMRLAPSGYADISALISAINEGAIFKFISKPWQQDEMKIAVREAVHKHMEMITTRMLAEQAALDNAELFMRDATEAEAIRERNLVLERKTEELKLYQNAFHSIEIPLLMFDVKGRLINANPAASHLLQQDTIADSSLPAALREAVMGITSGKIPPFEPHHIAWNDGQSAADLTVVTDNLLMSGILAVLR